jgi:putative nucleotidyltransferase with HDIG domain
VLISQIRVIRVPLNKWRDLMRNKVEKIWPEINWIKNEELKTKVFDCWVYAVEKSVLTPEDLEVIPFSLLIKDCNVSFMNHKRTCVQLSVDIANRMKENFGDEIQIDMDLLIAGAILIDVGKLLEYDKVDGKLTTSKAGKLLRHPFSGVALADRFDLPPEVQHIIAYHAKEGDLAKRSVEAIIVHHADFVSFEPFKA